jgi:hypothetical protein
MLGSVLGKVLFLVSKLFSAKSSNVLPSEEKDK